MNATAQPTSPNSTTELQAKEAKHQKKSRFFPAANQIEKGDRLSIPKGTNVYCSAVSANIILTNDIRVEVISIDGSTEGPSFIVTKLQRSNEGGGWTPDSKLGNLDVQYTDLAAWHYQSKA